MTPQVSKLLHRQAELAGKMHDGVSPASAAVNGEEPRMVLEAWTTSAKKEPYGSINFSFFPSNRMKGTPERICEVLREIADRIEARFPREAK